MRDTYVCISHRAIAPCLSGEHHLLSNWPADVAKIMKDYQPRYYTDN